jgi:hypothetical protein
MHSSTATVSSGSAHPPYRPASARASRTSLRSVLAMAGSDAAPARSVAVVGAGVRSVGAPSVSVSLLVSVSVVWSGTLLARVLVL